MPVISRLVKAGLLLTMAFASASGSAQTDTVPAKFSYVPKVHGVVRPRWEMETESGLQRFQVANARLWADGNIAPWADYRVLVDFCDQGTVKFIDAWVRFKSQKGWNVQLGQFRMPFGVDPFRGPQSYYFANRSFIGKQVCNHRSPGIMAGYAAAAFPLTVSAGVFNPSPFGSHNVWKHGVSYSGKVLYSPGHWQLATGFMSVRPGSVRANMVDAAVTWNSGRWLVEGEYIWEHYCAEGFKDTHAYNFFADYHMPLKLAWFNRLSFQGRFDGMTLHRNLTTLDNEAARNRVTLGATISYIRAAGVHLDLRVNYEQYFYHHGYEVPQGQGNKLVAEAVFAF